MKSHFFSCYLQAHAPAQLANFFHIVTLKLIFSTKTWYRYDKQKNHVFVLPAKQKDWGSENKTSGLLPLQACSDSSSLCSLPSSSRCATLCFEALYPCTSWTVKIMETNCIKCFSLDSWYHDDGPSWPLWTQCKHRRVLHSALHQSSKIMLGCPSKPCFWTIQLAASAWKYHAQSLSMSAWCILVISILVTNHLTSWICGWMHLFMCNLMGDHKLKLHYSFWHAWWLASWLQSGCLSGCVGW